MFGSWRTRDDEWADIDPAQQAIDISELDTDHHNPFHSDQPHKSRWLLTTCVAGIAGGLVIGGALLGTFGFNSPLAGLTRGAGELQQTQNATKGDRIYGHFGPTSIVSRRDVSDFTAEQPYKRITVAFDRAEAEGPLNRRNSIISNSGLVGSLAPSYFNGPATRRTGLKPNVLAPVNSTTLSKSFVKADSLPYDETLVLGEGQTLLSVLMEKGTAKTRAISLVGALEPVYPTKNLRDGQRFRLTVQLSKDLEGRDIIEPIKLAFQTEDKREIVVEMDENGRYASRTIDETENATRLANASRHRSKARIRKSLYVAAKDQGVPEPIIIEMMRVHAYDVDFQREIRPGDSFEVFYGEPDDRNKSGDRDVVLYSALTLSGKTKGYFRFTTADDGITDYYDYSGRSATKFLTRTPINGARISSGFGWRRHPILGYTKLHNGIDFSAPYGTPIKAAGNGTIERIGRVGTYGKYIRIRHTNGYKTAYAHMSRFAKGLKTGSRVRQNQVIGYVGSTGRSTGPHLHFEVLYNNKQVNPLNLKLPTGRQLKGEMLARFNQEKQRIKTLMAGAPVQTQVAQADQ